MSDLTPAMDGGSGPGTAAQSTRVGAQQLPQQQQQQSPSSSSSSRRPSTATSHSGLAGRAHRGSAAAVAEASTSEPTPAQQQQQPLLPREAHPEDVAAAAGSADLLGYTAAEMAQVRAVLADAGYPNASDEDVQAVLLRVRQQQQQQQQQQQAHYSASQGSATMGATTAENSPAQQQPQQSVQTPRNVVHTARATHSRPPREQRPAWDPSTRLHDITDPQDGLAERAMARRQPPIVASAWPGAFVTDAAALASSPSSLLKPPVRLERYVKYYERALREFYEEHPDARPDLQAERDAVNGGRPSSESHGPDDGTDSQSARRGAGRPLHVLGAPLTQPFATANVGGDGAARRVANVVYGATGDARYRYNLLLDSTRPSSSSRSTAAPRRSLTRPPQKFATDYNPLTADRQRGRVLSTFSVNYLRADGSTLPRKADPVARGQQLRTLWSRDSFLKQQSRWTKPEVPRGAVAESPN